MLKHQHLADTARNYTDPAAVTYPVKRRGERRRLVPNQAGIDWLENETGPATDIERLGVLGRSEDRLDVQVSNGYYAAQRRGHYTRPMIQVISLGSDPSSDYGTRYRRQCEACYDFARTWNCPDHHEKTWNARKVHWEDPSSIGPGSLTALGLDAIHRARLAADGIEAGARDVHNGGGWYATLSPPSVSVRYATEDDRPVTVRIEWDADDS